MDSIYPQDNANYYTTALLQFGVKTGIVDQVEDDLEKSGVDFSFNVNFLRTKSESKYTEKSVYDIGYNIEDHERFIGVYNSIVEKYNLQTNCFIYVKDEEHKKIIDDLSQYDRYTLLGNEDNHLSKFSYYSLFMYDKHDIVDKIERLGFKKDLTHDKYYEFDYFNKKIFGATLYFNKANDVFPLKCIDGSMDICKVYYFPFEGTIPLTYDE